MHTATSLSLHFTATLQLKYLLPLHLQKGFNVLELTGAIIPQGKLVSGVKAGRSLRSLSLYKCLCVYIYILCTSTRLTHRAECLGQAHVIIPCKRYDRLQTLKGFSTLPTSRKT